MPRTAAARAQNQGGAQQCQRRQDADGRRHTLRDDQQPRDHGLASAEPIRKPAGRPLTDGLGDQTGCHDHTDQRIGCAALPQIKRKDRQDRPDPGARNEHRRDDAIQGRPRPGLLHRRRLVRNGAAPVPRS